MREGHKGDENDGDLSTMIWLADDDWHPGLCHPQLFFEVNLTHIALAELAQKVIDKQGAYNVSAHPNSSKAIEAKVYSFLMSDEEIIT